MRVLVTGAAGFIGSNLCRLLVAEGVEPIALDDGSAGVNELPEGIERLDQSCAELAGSPAVLRGVDAVVHLAARPSVDYANREPLAALDANVGDTLRVLLAAAEAGVQRVVCASSGAAVGEVKGAVREDLVPHPVSIYGATKTAAEAFCSAVRASYGIDAVALRFSNCYGPHSRHKQSAVHLFARRGLAGQPIEVYGDGSQTRDFIYVEDICRAILAAAQRACGPVLQVSTSVETSVNELIAALGEAIGRPLEVRHAERRRGDVLTSVSDNRLAREQLDWQPRVELREGIARTVDYYRSVGSD